MSPRTDETPDPPTDRAQVQRVAGLLASVHDAIGTLQKLGTQLEREVARALYQDDAAGGSAVARLELENARLKHALEGRAVIEQAKGVIIARTGSTEQDAFSLLTQVARSQDISVRDAAAAVVQTGEIPAALAQLASAAGSSTLKPPTATPSTATPPTLKPSTPTLATRDQMGRVPVHPISPSTPAIRLSQLLMPSADETVLGSSRRRWRLPSTHLR
jgi:hypothetical protein